MKIGYVVNLYPAVSHSFIRREIQALEQLGLVINRFTVRTSPVLVDEEDVREQAKTRGILALGVVGLVKNCLTTWLRQPVRSLLTLGTALQFGSKSARGVWRHLAYFIEACTLKQWCHESGITHLHCHFGTNATAVALLCQQLGGPTYSFTSHGPEEYDAPYSLSLVAKIEQAQFVVAISSFGLSQLQRHCPYALWTKFHLVHCTVDDAYLHRPQIPNPGNNRLVCVGRLTAQKGQLLLLEAVQELLAEGEDVELILAGDGEMRPLIAQRIQALGLEKQVSITGWLTGEEVKQQLVRSRAMILPSFAEGLPVVIMEALALHRPVISTFVAGIPELVDSACGRLVPAGSKPQLKLAIKEMLAMEPSELARMGAIGAERVRERHASHREAAKLSSLLSQRLLSS